MINTTLRDRILKASTIELTSVLSESTVFADRERISTVVPMVNVALCGELDGGLLPGVTIIAGPPKHFKTIFALLMLQSFQRKYPEGVCLFYDSEFGSPEGYFNSLQINMDKVIHTPITNIEMFKHDIAVQLESMKKGDEVFIFVDSLGNIASKKEVDDALKGNDAADMTRAKQIKSVFRIIGPSLTLKGIPLICVNHTYQTQETYSKEVVSGGRGGYYNGNDIWVIGRKQDKDGKELSGYEFIINIDKSRTVREKSKIPITVSFESGIFKWSGLLEEGVESGLITQSGAWYQCEGMEKKSQRKTLEEDDSFWEVLIKNEKFKEHIRKKYCLEGNLTTPVE
jgi:RecA/RadA recombinase